MAWLICTVTDKDNSGKAISEHFNNILNDINDKILWKILIILYCGEFVKNSIAVRHGSIVISYSWLPLHITLTARIPGILMGAITRHKILLLNVQ